MAGIGSCHPAGAVGGYADVGGWAATGICGRSGAKNRSEGCGCRNAVRHPAPHRPANTSAKRGGRLSDAVHRLRYRTPSGYFAA